MALTVLRPAVKRLIVVLILGLGAVGPAASVSLAATLGVTAPTATVDFLSGITFTGSATLTTDVSRVEIVVDVEGSRRSIVAEVPTGVTSGTASLTWSLDTPGGFLLPNSDVNARFRLTLGDGTIVEGPSSSVHYDDTRYAWKTVTGDFVTVHWVDGGRSFGLRAMQIGDDAVRSVSALLGVTERKPIDFYVYGDRAAFYDVLGPGARENVGGEAHPDIRTLFANIGPDAVDDPWVGIVIPHELTHLVFDSAVTNAYHYPPRWLNEGIAVYLSESFGSSDRNAVRAAVGAGTVMPLRALGAQFPTTGERFSLAYSESVAAVSFLVEIYGRDALVKLVRSYADGVSDDEAFSAALGVDVVGFETAWLDSIGAPSPSPFGPQPAPAGPIPADWGGAAPPAGIAAGDSPSPAPTAIEESPSSTSTGDAIPAAIGLGFAIVVAAALRTRRQSTRRITSKAAAAVSDPEPDLHASTDLGMTEDPAPDETGTDR